MSREHVDVNRAHWDELGRIHEHAYGLEAFADPAHLSETVRFDLPRLGSVDGLTGVHLQCHVGSDTLSLARLGARMTGLDFSPRSLAVARQLSARAGPAVDFVEAEVERALEVLPAGGFDFVYTGIGALCWLPDIAAWAKVVGGLLRPGGFLFIREGHPMLWALSDPRPDGLMVVEHPYFQAGGGSRFTAVHSYVEHAGQLDPSGQTFISFNHGLAETITALMAAGLTLTLFEEHPSAPWNALGPLMVKGPLGEYQLAEAPWRLAATYTLRMVKEG